MQRIKKTESRLALNTVMLFALTFSNYLFNFITIPYQTRVLGPAIYGNIGFALSIMTYFQMFMDFGFLLSATEDIAREREDKKKVSEIFTCVMICKVFLIAVSFLTLTVICLTVPRFKTDVPLFFIYLAAFSAYAFLPDFLYRGIEDMKSITVRSVLIKFFCTCMIFVLLKKPSQYYIIPILTGVGNVGAVIGVYFHLRHLGYSFVRVKFSDVIKSFKRSGFFFFSRIASAVFTATNTFILGMVYGSGSVLVGHYATSEKVISTAKQVVTPVSDSLYPYMIKHRNFRLVKKLMLIGMPILFVGCAVVMVFAKPLCAFAFGKEYYEAGTYLRLLTPVVFFSFPGIIFGFPVLSPIGLAKQANNSVIYGAILQILMLVVLYFTIGLTPERICIATCITEAFTCSYRVITVWIHRDRLKPEPTVVSE